MSYKIKRRDPSLTETLRRVARDQIDSAIAVARSNRPDEERVHEARRRCKKLRGLLRLVRPGFSGFARENAAIRDAADRLSGSRDLAVLRATVEDLRRTEGSTVSDTVWDRLLRSFGPVPAGGQATVPSDTPLTAFVADFVKIRDRVGTWSIKGDGLDVAMSGLKANYSQMREAMRTALKSQDDDDFHEWRKRVKYLGHHLSLLRPVAPDILKPLGASAAELGDALGLHHDLSVLRDHIAQHLSPEDRGAIEGLIASRQKAHADRAETLGAQIAAELPKAFARRMRTYWRTYQDT